MVYNLNHKQWFLLCVQAKSAVYDTTNWTTKKANEIVSNIEKVLSNIQNSFRVVSGIKDDVTYAWDEKQKERGRNLALMHEKSIFAGRKCVTQHFGPQYEHILNWIIGCVTFANYENGVRLSKMKKNIIAMTMPIRTKINHHNFLQTQVSTFVTMLNCHKMMILI